MQPKASVMLIKLSSTIQRDVEDTVRTSIGQSLIIDVFATAETIRRKHEHQNVAIEDIAHLVARTGSQFGCALEFGDRGRMTVERPPLAS